MISKLLGIFFMFLGLFLGINYSFFAKNELHAITASFVMLAGVCMIQQSRIVKLRDTTDLLLDIARLREEAGCCCVCKGHSEEEQ